MSLETGHARLAIDTRGEEGLLGIMERRPDAQAETACHLEVGHGAAQQEALRVAAGARKLQHPAVENVPVGDRPVGVPALASIAHQEVALRVPRQVAAADHGPVPLDRFEEVGAAFADVVFAEAGRSVAGGEDGLGDTDVAERVAGRVPQQFPIGGRLLPQAETLQPGAPAGARRQEFAQEGRPAGAAVEGKIHRAGEGDAGGVVPLLLNGVGQLVFEDAVSRHPLRQREYLGGEAAGSAPAAVQKDFDGHMHGIKIASLIVNRYRKSYLNS